MNALTLAEEIINGRRITREDDLSFFLTCDLEELCEGADRIREVRLGDKVDLCSIINGRSGRCPEDCKYCTIIRTVRSMISFRRKRFWRPAK